MAGEYEGDSMSDTDSNDADQLRENFPHEVYARKADYVDLAMKRMTARRMVGWLREYAEYAEVSGADKTAEHARYVANGLAKELPKESVEGRSADTDTEHGDTNE